MIFHSYVSFHFKTHPCCPHIHVCPGCGQKFSLKVWHTHPEHKINPRTRQIFFFVGYINPFVWCLKSPFWLATWVNCPSFWKLQSINLANLLFAHLNPHFDLNPQRRSRVISYGHHGHHGHPVVYHILYMEESYFVDIDSV